jgi:4-hydroxy-2-oxoheptanedioate aldolase
MKNPTKFACCLAASACLLFWAATTVAQTPKPKRVNRAIELLEQGQPIYYTGSHSGTNGTFEQGKEDAATWADYISYDMEAAPYDINGLTAYMKGLAAAGPTRTGHHTPAVIVNVPVRGTDEATVRANSWMFEQVLAAGVHGILLCHATTAGAVRALVEAVRYPSHDGMRGAHGAETAAKIWGISTAEYLQKADVWPLNPNGELMLGVKIEDKYGYAHMEEIVRVPGISFGEGGPGDMALSFGFSSQTDARAKEVQDNIFHAAKAQHLYWLGVGAGGGRGGNLDAAIESTIKEGHMIGSGEQIAAAGRKYTKRPLPY